MAGNKTSLESSYSASRFQSTGPSVAIRLFHSRR